MESACLLVDSNQPIRCSYRSANHTRKWSLKPEWTSFTMEKIDYIRYTSDEDNFAKSLNKGITSPKFRKGQIPGAKVHTTGDNFWFLLAKSESSDRWKMALLFHGFVVSAITGHSQAQTTGKHSLKSFQKGHDLTNKWPNKGKFEFSIWIHDYIPVNSRFLWTNVRIFLTYYWH